MIVTRLLLLYPDRFPQVWWGWWALAGMVGLYCYFMGSRFSRGVTTLGLVLAGALLGKMAPKWFGWHVDPMATTIGGSVIFGLVGFMLHRWVMAWGLGMMVAGWVGLGLFVHAETVKTWEWPAWSLTWTEMGAEYQKLLGNEVLQRMSAMCGLGFLAALVVGVIFPRLTLALFWVMMGMTVMAAIGLGWVAYHTPKWLEKLPGTTRAELIWLGAILLFGLFVQWRSKASAASPPKTEPEPAPAAPLSPAA